MRKLFVLLAAVATLALAAPADAQVSLGGTAAFHNDFDFGVGAQVGVPLPALHPSVRGLGDFTWFFPGDGLDYFEVNGNLVYDIPVADKPFTPFVLGGLNVARISMDNAFGGVDASSTEVGLNLGGGVTFATESELRPAVGAKIELSGGEGFVLFGSLTVGG